MLFSSGLCTQNCSAPAGAHVRFLPFQAASRGEVQRSLNTLYGSALSTLCLTVPAVLLIGAVIHTDVILGLDPLEMVLLGLTLFLVRPTSGRVTRLDGLVLLVIFLFWIALQLG